MPRKANKPGPDGLARVTFLLPVELVVKLDQLAQQQTRDLKIGVTRSDVVRQAIHKMFGR